MSVLIRGMEMPKNCAECRLWSICECLKDYEDYVSVLESVDDGDLVRDDNCPLVEIKEVHGDLVDREWVRDSINHSCWIEHNDYLEAIGIIDDAPTIIEAEGETDGR